MTLPTEIVIGVLGHPIAGNPAQFTLQRAFESLDLDWRVLSFEILPDRLADALAGAEAFGFRGLWIDPTLSETAAQWLKQHDCQIPADAGRVDCVSIAASSDQRHPSKGYDLRSRWLAKQVTQHFQDRGRRMSQVVWVGREQPASVPAWATPATDPPDSKSPVTSNSEPSDDEGTSPDQASIEPAKASPDESASPTITWSSTWEAVDLASLRQADLICIDGEGSGDQPSPDDVPTNAATALVVDLSESGCESAEWLSRCGYQVVSFEARRVGLLAEAIALWTEKEVDLNVLREAIDEYLAI
ncbi:MAG: hypothetical protein AAGA03_07925 [Planctomycetota bacterium]